MRKIIIAGFIIIIVIAFLFMNYPQEDTIPEDAVIVNLDDEYKKAVTGQTKYGYPGRLFDNNDYLASVCDEWAQYIEIEFTQNVVITAVKEKGIGQNGDGQHTLQVYYDKQWVPILVKNTESSNDWGDEVPVNKLLETNKARWVSTELDTGPFAGCPEGGNMESELILKGYAV